MRARFDPAKDASNDAKHGISLARASELVIETIVPAKSVGGEARFRAYGLLDGLAYVLVFTVRDTGARAISLRRTSRKEFEEHVESD